MRHFLLLGIVFLTFHIGQTIPDLCLLKPDAGEGPNYITALYYDPVKEQCNPFMYKGEKGNANRFENERECIRNCSARAEELYPMDASKACTFKKQIGECTNNLVRYYYDSIYDKCKKFLWTGCHGNGNRFLDYASCDATCNAVNEDDDDEMEEDKPDPPPDLCLLKPDAGEGPNYITAFYYDPVKEQCNPFMYKGEKGNANRFENERECIRNCSARAEELYPMDASKACTFKKQIGECTNNLVRYYYDSIYDKCKKFLWTGCHGNGNRFLDYASCEATCNAVNEDDDDEMEEDKPDPPPDLCLLKPDAGEGPNYITAFYYDPVKEQCNPFMYKGEKGNANRFENERECIRNCSARAEELYPMDASKACTFKKQIGECTNNLVRYYYDSIYDKCKKFLWTGCHGNGNRFLDYASCDATCNAVNEDDDDEMEEDKPDPPPDLCLLKPDAGEGPNYITAFYYDPVKEQCNPFMYKGEKGNANRFENERECIRNCSARAEELYPMDASKACTFKKQIGECTNNLVRYYYDSIYDKCKKFLWTGCHGNGNRFLDYASCDATCNAVNEDDDDEMEEDKPDPPPDFCLLKPDAGEGPNYIIAFYYDPVKEQCNPFMYKGEKGNANRFENERECIRNCSARAEELYPMDASKACTFKKQIGECNNNLLRYYYDSIYDKCKKFLWTGCHGNGNRFLDYASCDATCNAVNEDGDEMEADKPDPPTET